MNECVMKKDNVTYMLLISVSFRKYVIKLVPTRHRFDVDACVLSAYIQFRYTKTNILKVDNDVS